MGDRNACSASVLGAQIPRGPAITYTSDFWRDYNGLFPDGRHLQGKAHTYTVESMNNQLRCYLARLRRKTHCYSKSLANLRDSLLLVFQRKLGCKLVPASGYIECPRLWRPGISIPI